MFHNSKHPSLNHPGPYATSLNPPHILGDQRLAWHVIDRYIAALPDDDYNHIERKVMFHIAKLRAAFPDLNALKDRRVLDIACGSREYKDDKLKQHEPWMCRLLAYLGAKPVGIDIAPQRNEEFEYHRVDLTVPDALSFLEGASFDAGYICAFPTRKVIRELRSEGRSWAPIRENILFHMMRALKPDGVIIRQFGDEDEQLVRSAVAQPPPPIITPPPRNLAPHELPRRFFDDDEYLL